MNFNIQTMLYSDILIPYQQKIYETKPDIDLVNSLKLSSMLFFDSLDFRLNINNDEVLSRKVVDKIAVLFMERFFDSEIGFETEQKFMFKLSSILHSNEDNYSKRFTLNFKEFLDGNVNLKKDYDKIDSSDKESNTKGDSNSKENIKGDSKTIGNSNGNTTSKENENNFNRKLTDSSPADRLGITANDGIGLIKNASGIEELKENNHNDKTGTQSQHKQENNDFKTDSISDNKFSSNEKENKKNETHYNDYFRGYDFRNKSQGIVYKEYIDSLENVYMIILNDCEKCFLSIL